MLVNDAALGLLADIAAVRDVGGDPRTREVLDLLLDLELVCPVTDEGGEAGRAEPDQFTAAGSSGRAAATSAETDLRPVACTLFLTTACNLRCLYCYASGGDRPRFLSERVALDAIDFIVGNAVDGGVSEVTVAFHGGGEPTLAGDTLVRCVEHARKRCCAEGLELKTGLATNGVMSDRMRDYLAATMDSVMVSVDGPADVQDRLRPQADGGPSSVAVERSLERLAAGDCSLGARVTCTSSSIEHASETVRHLVEVHGLKTIHLEPLFVCGRSTGNGLRPPTPARFVEVFRTCRDFAGRHGADVVYSGARQKSLGCSFCQASTPSFNVTTDGDVTACYEVTGRDDPRADPFVFGSYDAERRSFAFDDARVAALRRLTVNDAPRCSRCFSKYHCAGDCASKRLYPGADDAVIARCQINRRLTRDQLEEALFRPAAASQLEAAMRG